MNPTIEELSASLAACVYLLTPQELKELHDSIDAVAGSLGETDFRSTRIRLQAALQTARSRDRSIVPEA